MLIMQVVGPYYFDRPVVKGHIYLGSSSNVLLPMTLCFSKDTTFEQDQALPHYRMTVRQMLDEKLPGSWNGAGGLIPCPAHFLDLTALDVFLWWEVKDMGYQNSSIYFERIKKEKSSLLSQALMWIYYQTYGRIARPG